MSPSVSVRLLLTQSDTRLVAYAHAGHERAFEALVQRYRRPLLGYCRRLLLSDERAEDVLQQALLQAWLALRAGSEVSEVKPWLYKIVHNSALNALRVSRYDYSKLSESLSGADAPQEDLDRRIAVREALAGLAALPELQREALLRTAVEGGSHQQVARDLGLSENALRGLVYRARTTLRAAASAMIPPPLLSWALGSGGRGAPVVERLAELGAGGGSAGVAGLLMKGAAVAVTASMLAGGIAAVPAHPKRTHAYASPHAGARRPHPSSTPLRLAEARSANLAGAATASRPRPGNTASPTNRPTPRIRQGRPQASTVPFGTAIAPQAALMPSNGGDGGRGDQRLGGSGGRDEAQSPNATGSTGTTTAEVSGDGSRGSGHTEQGSDGGGSSLHDGGGGGASGESTSGGSQIAGDSGAGQGDGSAENGRPEGSHDRQGSSWASSSTTTNSSSKDEQSAPSEGTKGG